MQYKIPWQWLSILDRFFDRMGDIAYVVEIWAGIHHRHHYHSTFMLLSAVNWHTSYSIHRSSNGASKTFVTDLFRTEHKVLNNWKSTYFTHHLSGISPRQANIPIELPLFLSETNPSLKDQHITKCLELFFWKIIYYILFCFRYVGFMDLWYLIELCRLSWSTTIWICVWIDPKMDMHLYCLKDFMTFSIRPYNHRIFQFLYRRVANALFFCLKPWLSRNLREPCAYMLPANFETTQSILSVLSVAFTWKIFTSMSFKWLLYIIILKNFSMISFACFPYLLCGLGCQYAWGLAPVNTLTASSRSFVSETSRARTTF